MSASTNHRDDGCGPYDEGRHLRIWLGHNDAPCPVCGYNLRHLSGNICPECGQQFKLRVGDVDLRFGLLLAFIAPMTMLCGLSLVLWGVVIATLTSGPGPWRIGVMMLGAALRRAGLTVRFFVQHGERQHVDFAHEIASWRPDAVGVSVYSANYAEGRRVVCALRRRHGFGGPSVFGGPHASVAPEIARDEGVDYVLRGEGELAGPALFAALLRGERPADIPGLVWSEHGELRESGPFELVKDLTSLPWALRDIADLGREFSLGAFDRNKAILMSSRGCPSACAFCSTPLLSRRRVRFRDPDDVAREALHLRDRYGVRFLFFADDELFARRRHVEALCRALLRHRVALPFYCMGKIDLVDPALLELLAMAGCHRLFLGAERPPGDDPWTWKARDGQAVDRALAAAREVGIYTHVGFMVGFPDEDEASLRRLCERVRALPADYLGVTVFTPLPGTALYAQMVRDGVELLAPERAVYNRLSFRHPNLTEEQLLGWRQRIFHAFYFSAGYLRRAAGRVASHPDLLADYARLLWKGARSGLLATRPRAPADESRRKDDSCLRPPIRPA